MAYLFALLLLLPAPVWAWNGAGHRLVAALAWGEMNEAAKSRAEALLQQHPDYPRWLKRQQERDDPAYGVFQEAATWPDDIRRDPRFHDADEPPTAQLPGYPDMSRQGHWHFRNELENRRSQPGEIDTRLELLARELRQGSPVAQAYALPWLLHLVADLHQPLHAGGRGDRGGNGFEVENPFNSRKPFMSLHIYWDDLPGPPWLRGKRLEQQRLRLAALPPVAQGQVAGWREESLALVATRVYPEAKGSLLPLITPEFHRQAQATSDARLAAAGQRLGRWLNQLLAPAAGRSGRVRGIVGDVTGLENRTD